MKVQRANFCLVTTMCSSLFPISTLFNLKSKNIDICSPLCHHSFEDFQKSIVWGCGAHIPICLPCCWHFHLEETWRRKSMEWSMPPPVRSARYGSFVLFFSIALKLTWFKLWIFDMSNPIAMYFLRSVIKGCGDRVWQQTIRESEVTWGDRDGLQSHQVGVFYIWKPLHSYWWTTNSKMYQIHIVLQWKEEDKICQIWASLDWNFGWNLWQDFAVQHTQGEKVQHMCSRMFCRWLLTMSCDKSPFLLLLLIVLTKPGEERFDKICERSKRDIQHSGGFGSQGCEGRFKSTK